MASSPTPLAAATHQSVPDHYAATSDRTRVADYRRLPMSCCQVNWCVRRVVSSSPTSVGKAATLSQSRFGGGGRLLTAWLAWIGHRRSHQSIADAFTAAIIPYKLANIGSTGAFVGGQPAICQCSLTITAASVDTPIINQIDALAASSPAATSPVIASTSLAAIRRYWGNPSLTPSAPVLGDTPTLVSGTPACCLPIL